MISLFLAVAALAGSMHEPITMVADRTSGQVSLTVTGQSDVPVHASYELEASSGSGNRSVQRGSVDLIPGRRVDLIQLRLGGTGEGWSAKLKVITPTRNYEQSLSSN